MQCVYCEKEFKFLCRVTAHEKTCTKNPSRPERKISNQYIRAKELGLSKPTMKPYVWTAEDKLKRSASSKRTNKEYWTTDARLRHSIKMREVVINNPDSYSKCNVSGRVKSYEIQSSDGITSVKGMWELKVAQWLNDNNIAWTNSVVPYSYMWKGNWHLYFPDFYLIDYDIVIEVKGYETDRDHAKWAAVVDKQFKVIRGKDLNNLQDIFKQIL